MRFSPVAVFLSSCITLWGPLSAGAAPVADFVDFSRAGLPGRMYVPPEAVDSTMPRPLILFLHGAGEIGSDNLAQINQNIDNLLGFQVADIDKRQVVKTVRHSIPKERQGEWSRCHGLGVRPDQQDYYGTALLLEIAKKLELPQICLLANKVFSSIDPGRLAGKLSERFGFEVIGVLPLSEDVARLESRELFVRSNPDHVITHHFRSIAARLLAS